MTSKLSVAISSALGLLLLGLLSFVFFQSFAALPLIQRALLTCIISVIFFLIGPLIFKSLRQVGASKYWLIGVTVLFGVFIYQKIEVASSNSASVFYSNATQVDGVKPSSLSAWGRVVGGYSMHPAYESAVVPNSLIASFLSQPNEVRVFFTKPSFALYQADGKPTQSDGVSVDISALDAKGNITYSSTLIISQDKFLHDKWITSVIRSEAGIASVKVTLGIGPPGSNAYFDSTLVGFQVWGWATSAELLGKVLLLSLGFFVLGLCLMLNASFVASSLVNRRKLISSQSYLHFALVFVFLMGLAYWSESKTSYVFFWDFRNYWEKTEVLYGLLKAGMWMDALETFTSAYASDYSTVPAVLPALSSLVTGYPTRVNYSLIITALYAVPAYIMVAYLAKRLIDGKAPGSYSSPMHHWMLASFPIIFGLPIYFGTTLFLMPDIGGVALFIAALLASSALIDAVVDQADYERPWHISINILRTSISLGVLLSLMFVFRRWYVFAAAGIVCSLSTLLVVEVFRSRALWKVVLFRSVASGLFAVFAALPLLCWILFVWSHDIGQHDYSTLYAAYKHPLSDEARLFLGRFGLIPLVLCIIGGIFFYRVGGARRLLFLLAVSTCIACVLFLYIQSPGRHHYFLLMPFLGAGLGGISIILVRRYGKTAWALFCLLLICGALSSPFLSKKVGVTTFADYLDWAPQYQKYSDGLSQVSQWLARPENERKKFCFIASSFWINPSIFGELWQIEPAVAKHAYDERMVFLGQVDSINGPPAPVIKQCQIFLVGVPFQSHLGAGQQLTVEIVQKDMVDGTGIGAAVDRSPKIFPMGDNIEVRAYQTTRDITEAEYADLVKRFLNAKGPSYSNPVDQ
jgi:hypothetical protein